eukprot:TRINITY_DN2544_c0_g1_i1.p1 TRINITY_DN2544_c0_g1~~TRINITY_DN2544_c0_g1_i1.p1  ORF type:complete len:179 (-),score=33.45 TRINITY_DN2544_c0_g1_i1:213-749(-)
MFNGFPFTKPDVPIRVNYIDKHKEVIVTSNRKISAGEEVLDLYRKDFTNTDYLLNYGFLFEEIPDITFGLEVSFLPQDLNVDMKKKVLLKFPGVNEMGKGMLVRIANSSDESSVWVIYSVYRVLYVKNQAQLSQLQKNMKNGTHIAKISNENEKEAMSALYEKLKKRLSEYPTTISVK